MRLFRFLCSYPPAPKLLLIVSTISVSHSLGHIMGLVLLWLFSSSCQPPLLAPAARAISSGLLEMVAVTPQSVLGCLGGPWAVASGSCGARSRLAHSQKLPFHGSHGLPDIVVVVVMDQQPFSHGPGHGAVSSFLASLRSHCLIPLQTKQSKATLLQRNSQRGFLMALQEWHRLLLPGPEGGQGVRLPGVRSCSAGVRA